LEHHLDRSTRDTYIYRLYPEYGTLRYAFALPISYRGKGEWEAYAWNSLVKLWPEAPLSLFPEILVWIYNEMRSVEPTFLALTGTFEVDRLKAYKRMFKKYIEVTELRPIKKTYNGATLDGMVVSFEPILSLQRTEAKHFDGVL